MQTNDRMNEQLSHQGSGSRAGRTPRTAGYAAAALLVCMLAAGVLYWVDFTRQADAAARAQSEPQPKGSSADFEYFPSLYVNQGKEAEPHIQAY
jgi:type VI protein secretion system component VasF